jgi:hypothetical protein
MLRRSLRRCAAFADHMSRSQAFAALSHLTLSQSADPHSLYLNVNVEGTIRLPSTVVGGVNGTVVLVFTTAGRFVVSGKNVRPAPDSLARMDASQILTAVWPLSSDTLRSRPALPAPRRRVPKVTSFIRLFISRVAPLLLLSVLSLTCTLTSMLSWGFLCRS